MVLLTREQTEQLVEDWCNDLLENGDKQGKGALNENGKFCCLGRLCEILPKYVEGLEKQQEDELGMVRYVYARGGGSATYLPCQLADDIGISSYNGNIESMNRSLTLMNDDPMPFSKIAEVIQQHKTELFPILK